jgi:hypothetical protein
MRSSYTRARPLLASSVLARAIAAGMCYVFAGCGGGGVADKPVGPVIPVDTTKPPPTTVQRATLAVTVNFDPADASLASTAGVTPAGITVRIQRVRSTEAARTAVTGADGIARFTELLEGSYQVSADRPLTSAEVARLPAADREASIFAGGLQVSVAPPQGQTTVSLVASRRGSLLISEVFLYQGPGVPFMYGFGSYFEVYNNADTTAYLDGVLWFATQPQMHRQYTNSPGCAEAAPLRLDSAGIWVNRVSMFPGSGRDYPVPPGEARVVAMDAINHAAASSPGSEHLDLSKAHFEQIGTDADVNNPFVPDLIRVLGGTGLLGRGFPMNHGQAYGLALASARPRITTGSFGSVESYRIPRDAVLDIAGIETTAASDAAITSTNPLCAPWLASVFERSPAKLGSYVDPRAISRRSLGRTPDGREILQGTRTSARDFDYAFPLRRSLLR